MTRILKLLTLVGGLVLSTACPGPAPADAGVPDGGADDDAGMIDDGGPGDAGEEPEPDPVQLSDVACDRVTPLPDDLRHEALQLADLHGVVRNFGLQSSQSFADAQLAAALLTDEVDVTAAVTDYVTLLQTACVTDAEAPAWGATLVTVVPGDEDAVVVVPGSDAADLGDASRVFVDVRALPATAEGDAALSSLLGQLYDEPSTPPSMVVRRHFGQEDHVISEFNVYSQDVATVDAPALFAPAADDGRAVVFITGARQSPFAARAVIELRLAGRAHVVGRAIRGEVAELSLVKVAGLTAATRARVLRQDSTMWPNELDADIVTDEPLRHLLDAALDAAPEPITEWTGSRAQPLPFNYNNELVSPDADLGALRAAIIIQHAQWTRFVPTIDLVQPGVDERTAQLWDELAALRMDEYVVTEHFDWLWRHGHALHDPHYGIYQSPPGISPYVGSLGLVLDLLEDGRPVVVTSVEDGVVPGDVITHVDGVAIADFIDQWQDRYSYATDDNMRYQLFIEITISRSAEREFTLEHIGGATSTVTLAADETFSTNLGFWPTPTRTDGDLSDLGAANVYYINLDQGVMNTLQAWSAAINQADLFDSLIIDMRGYPGVFAGQICDDFTAEAFTSPPYFTPVWTGPDALELQDDTIFFSPTAQVYDGNIVILHGPATQSAAEDFIMYMMGLGVIDGLVGLTTSGTDGNVTGVVMPGGFGTVFTGLEVQFPDGSRFQGVGITPDLEVYATAQGAADGTDEVLEAAIAYVETL